MKKLIVLLTMAVLAIGSYVVGGIFGLGLFIILGMVFELIFWRRLFNFKNRKPA